MLSTSVLSKIKNVELVRNQIRAAEQSGHPPERIVYPDHNGVKTIATGFNLERPEARSICESLGINFNATLAGAPLTVKQAQDLEDHVICETAQICINKLGQKHFDKLAPEQQASVISVALTPAMLGPHLTTYIRAGAYTSAADEIQYRSNRSKHVGMQNRRDREAELFRSAIPCAASPSSSTASSSSIPPPLSGGSVAFPQSMVVRQQAVPSIPTDIEVIRTFIGNFIQNHVRVSFDIPRPTLTRGQLRILDRIECFQNLQQEFLKCEKAIKEGKRPNTDNFERSYQQCRTIIIEQGNFAHCYDSSKIDNPYVAEVDLYCMDFWAALYGKKIVSQSERLDTIDEYKRTLDDLLTLDELKKVPASLSSSSFWVQPRQISLVVDKGNLPTNMGRRGPRCVCLPHRPGPVKRVHEFARLELKNERGEELVRFSEFKECDGKFAEVQEVKRLFNTNITWPTTQDAIVGLRRIQEQCNPTFSTITGWLDGAIATIGRTQRTTAEIRIDEEFVHAAEIGDIGLMRVKILAGINIDKTINKHGWTALHQAASYNQIDVIKFLLSEHADVEVQNTTCHNLGWRPLHNAAWNGCKEAITLLLEAGANPEARTVSAPPGHPKVTPAELAVLNDAYDFHDIPDFIQRERERIKTQPRLVS